MKLDQPIYLLALLVIPVGIALAYLARRRRRKYAVRLPTAGTLAALLPRESQFSRVLPGILFGCAVAALALALAKPEVTVREPVERASVMLVTDASGSMQAQDVAPTRLDAAKSAVESFLDEVPDQMRVGLLSYASVVETIEGPTTDRDNVRAASRSITAEGATATGDALKAAIDRLRETEDKNDPAPAAILLLSDGMTSQGVNPLEIAREAKAAGITISTVALGTPGGTVTLGGGFTRAVPPDPETLRQIASISGGQAFAADDADELDNVYKQVGSKLGTRPVQREATAGAAGIGALFLVGALALGLRRRGRLG
ncbi:MAG: VWA domain-containing protein [Solirubrobacteraceae bacterium]|nr:VWA domain-containing protein [Solirubrobacteraceae bacterium]